MATACQLLSQLSSNPAGACKDQQTHQGLVGSSMGALISPGTRSRATSDMSPFKERDLDGDIDGQVPK